jgi:hypothetical protein
VLICTGHSFANAWWLCSAILAAASTAGVLRVRAGLTREAPETLATAAGAG